MPLNNALDIVISLSVTNKKEPHASFWALSGRRTKSLMGYFRTQVDQLIYEERSKNGKRESCIYVTDVPS